MATKRIRIAVAVDSEGNHNASSYGGPRFGKRTQAQEDASAMDSVWQGLDSDDPIQAVVWVTAEVPIPDESVTVEGQVGEPCE